MVTIPTDWVITKAFKSRRDRYVRRSGDDYAEALADLLPWGPAWPRWEDSVLMRCVRGLAQIFGLVDRRAGDLLIQESDPRKTLELLPDWERNWGLPDPCFRRTETIEQRQQMLVFKMTMLGAQSREWFIWVANWLGYEIEITEFSPFMVGVSSVGDTRGMILWNDRPGTHPEVTDFRWEIGRPEMRFYWTVRVKNAPLLWFRAGGGESGIQHHLTIGFAEDLECLLNRWRPAHTKIIFDYSSLATGGSMAGTP